MKLDKTALEAAVEAFELTPADESLAYALGQAIDAAGLVPRKRCPIGLDDSPEICSAGSCDYCLPRRLAGQRDEAHAQIAALREALEWALSYAAPLADDVSFKPPRIKLVKAQVALTDTAKAAEGWVKVPEGYVVVSKDAIRQPFLCVFLDGRNEHGSHVLPCGADNLGHFNDDCVSYLEDQSEGIAEQIITEAERLGHKISHGVVTVWRLNKGGSQLGDEPAYMEYERVDPVLTELLIGTPDEQEKEMTFAAAPNPEAGEGTEGE